MKSKISLIISLIVTSVIFPQEDLKVLSSDRNSITLEYSPIYSILNEEINNETFVKVSLSFGSILNYDAIGAASLPTRQIPIGVPSEFGNTVEILSTSIKEVDGKILAPYEKVFIEVTESFSGIVMQKMGERGGILQDMTNEAGVVLVEFIIPTRKLFGYRSEFITDTKGTGILNTMFHKFEEDTSNSFGRNRGSLVAYQDGNTTLYGLTHAQGRGTLFIGPGTKVYRGQVIGRNSRDADIQVNIVKEKQQTNMRSRGEGVSEHFNAPKPMGLEEALEYIDDSELVEVTPQNIRIRKADLNFK